MPSLSIPAQPRIAVEDGIAMPQRMWAILTIALGLTLAVLGGGIANVALPAIAREVHTSPANSIWVVNAYQLAVTVSLLPLSSLGEIYGYRRIYQIGLVIFTIASFAHSSQPFGMTATFLIGSGNGAQLTQVTRGYLPCSPASPFSSITSHSADMRPNLREP